MSVETGRRSRYPEPPEGSWEALQRYASTRLLADMLLADRKALGLFDDDPAARWAEAEAMWERMHADG